MTTELALFYAFAAVTVGAALGVVTVKNTVHAALLLVLTFFSCACQWLLLRAEFLANVLVRVYVGGVRGLFRF
ncbi:MAG: NADH-quinone oxidoreductase subunit J, partial [Pseudomonadota bacterium]